MVFWQEENKTMVPNRSIDRGCAEPEEMAYGLARNVTCKIDKGRVRLVLAYPLKAIFLHHSWSPAFELFSQADLVPLKKIVPRIDSYRKEDIAYFLDNLVRKGFLEVHGFPILSEYPSVSVIIPVRNRPDEIEACLDSLTKVCYPDDKMEIIVVDDGSTDDTLLRISRFQARLISLKENHYASFCRNLGAAKANGEILAFVDSDCVVEPYWLMELIPVFERQMVGAVGGKVSSYFSRSGLNRYEEVKSSLVISTRAKSSLEGDRSFYVPSCNLLVRRKAFLKVGGYREDLIVGEDVDLCWRLQDRGYHVEFVPRGTVFHRHRNKILSFAKRRFDYGGSEPLLQRLHPNRRKMMTFPLALILFWVPIALGLLSGSMTAVALSPLVAILDAYRKGTVARRNGLTIPFAVLLLCTFRQYAAFLYYCCSFVSRYYLIGGVVLVWFWPWACAAILGAHIFAGTVEYVIKKPRLIVFAFLWYFTLEQLSYQLGVWWGCIRNFSFSSINPQVKLKASSGNS